MCRMPPKLRLDTPWPMHRAALRAHPAALAFCADVGLYAVLVTRQVATALCLLPDVAFELNKLDSQQDRYRSSANEDATSGTWARQKPPG